MSLFGKGRKAVVNFIDIDDDLANIGTSGELEGSKDSVIDYDSAAKIKELEDKAMNLSKIILILTVKSHYLVMNQLRLM